MGNRENSDFLLLVNVWIQNYVPYDKLLTGNIKNYLMLI